MNILVVDDKPEMLSLLKDVIQGVGTTVLTAGDASSALGIAQEGDISLIVSDVDMPPGESGVWLAQQVKAVRPDISIVLMSGRLEPIGHVADAFLQKPFRNSEVLQTIARLIGA